MNNITIIIPVRNDVHLLQILLDKIIEQSLKPCELIIVDSSDNFQLMDENTKVIFSNYDINIKVLYSKPLNPGGARNLGVISSNTELIAFLDVKTLPNRDWLKEAYKKITKDNSYGVFGKTSYEAKTRFEQCIRAATFGVKPIDTIPGSLFRRKIFSIVGSFLDNIVAGEDTDWILRARLHSIKLSYLRYANIQYTGLNGIKYLTLIKKWWRNYRACKDIPYLADHKSIYLIILNIALLMLAMNWNSLFANWNENSIFYINHITKIGIGLTVGLYIIYRGLILPIHRGVKINFLIPVNWLLILIFGISIDIVKLFAFIPSLVVIRNRFRYAFLRE